MIFFFRDNVVQIVVSNYSRLKLTLTVNPKAICSIQDCHSPPGRLTYTRLQPSDLGSHIVIDLVGGAYKLPFLWRISSDEYIKVPVHVHLHNWLQFRRFYLYEKFYGQPILILL